jgi:hypothetical protein
MHVNSADKTPIAERLMRNTTIIRSVVKARLPDASGVELERTPVLPSTPATRCECTLPRSTSSVTASTQSACGLTFDLPHRGFVPAFAGAFSLCCEDTK